MALINYVNAGTQVINSRWKFCIYENKLQFTWIIEQRGLFSQVISQGWWIWTCTKEN